MNVLGADVGQQCLQAGLLDEIRGTGWMVLADPVGNAFCSVRSDAERAP